MHALTFAANTKKEECVLSCSLVECKLQLFCKYACGGGLKQKALGAEVGCKNALFVAVAQATNKIVPMPQTVCRGISAQAFMPYFATRLCDVQPYFYSAAALFLP